MEELFSAVVLPDDDMADRLEEVGYRVEWREYPMAHAVCPQEIADIREWLLRVLA